MNSVDTNLLAKYENLIKIADTATKKKTTVHIIAKNFPEKPNGKEIITVFLAIFTEALLISQNNGFTVYDVIVDCKSVSTKNINKEFGKQIIGIMKSTFNDTLGRCVIYNTNNIFKAAYAFITPFIDKTTKSKIKVF
jgi:hypothetical protein